MNSLTIITGLPRSRTAWLSAFFDVEHEPIRSRQAAATIKEYGNQAGIIIDTAAPMFSEMLTSAWPHAKWVYIDRNVGEVRKSLRVIMPAIRRNEDSVIARLVSELTTCRQNHPGLEIAFDRMDDPDVMRQVWEIARPGRLWDSDRFARYCKLHIEAKEFSSKMVAGALTTNPQ